jgi:hypothetical protein
MAPMVLMAAEAGSTTTMIPASITVTADTVRLLRIHGDCQAIMGRTSSCPPNLAVGHR